MRSAESTLRETAKASGRTMAVAPAVRSAPAAVYNIFIRDIEVETCIGAFEHERIRSTVLIMNVDIELACQAGTSDRLRDTVDYGAVVTAIRHGMAGKRYYLLEKASEFVANLVLEKFGALWVQVSVAKVGIIKGVGRVGVMVERHRKGLEGAQGGVSSHADGPPCGGVPMRRRNP